MIPRMIGARQVFWEPTGDTGLEHLRLELDHERLEADGLIVRRMAQGAPVRLWYRLRCDGSARVRGVYLYENLQNGFRAELPVDTDGVVLDYPGQWRRRGPGGTTA